MNAVDRDVFLVPLHTDLVLVHAPLHGIQMMTNTTAAELLLNRAEVDPGRHPAIAQFRQMLESPTRRPRGCRSGPFLPTSVGLVPTRDCNLACSYCDFSAGLDGKRMDADTYTAAIDLGLRAASERGTGRLHVHFFGGEPFLAFDVVRGAVEHARAAAATREIEVTFEATTNGFYSQKVAHWIATNMTSVSLSLDGPPNLHDQARRQPRGKGSYARVARTAEILGAGDVDLCLRVCVAQHAAGRMLEIARHLSRFAPDSVSFEPLVVWGDPDGARPGPPDPRSFARGFAAASRFLARLGVRTIHATSQFGELVSSFCPLGNDGFIVLPDGAVQACYLPSDTCELAGVDVSFGQIQADGAIRLDHGKLARLRTNTVEGRPRCAECFCKWHCAGGCGVHHTPAGLDAPMDDRCRQTRLVTLWRILRSLELDQLADWAIEEWP